MPEHIVVVGLAGDDLSQQARSLLARADLVVGGERHLAYATEQGSARQLRLNGNVDAALDGIAAEDGRVCVLASGDPGFFGIVRALGARFGPEHLEVHPAPSSVSLAFARLGLSWDDAVVVSAHGRPLDEAVAEAAAASKAAVLTSPQCPPEAIGKALATLGASYNRIAVCSRLGAPDEQVANVDLTELADGAWDPLSVVVLLKGTGPAAPPSLSWTGDGAAEPFAHRAGMITKPEVRSVVVGKLDLPSAGVVWDVGAGSGSVAIECARHAPALRVFAVERRSDDAGRISANAASHAARVEVVNGEAPGVFAMLPDPDRVFVGGGGLDVLDAAIARARPGGRVVATFAAIDRATEAYHRLGNMVQVSVSCAAALPGGGVRLAAENPVFVAWGPGA